MSRLFETIRVQGCALQHISYHNERMQASQKLLFGIDEYPNLENQIRIPDYLDHRTYRCRVIYEKDIVDIQFEPFTPKQVGSLKLVDGSKLDYNHKYLDRSGLNHLFEQRLACDDILIVKNGFITDTSYANICFWDGRFWVTPATTLLRGTARARLLQEEKIIEREIRVEDLSRFFGARLINALLDFNNPLVADIPMKRIG